MDPTDDLLPALDAAAHLLRKSSESPGRKGVTTKPVSIANGDLQGVTHLLSAFGGMGSLSDVMLADAEANERLRALTGSLYELAAAIQRTADREMR